MHVVYALAEDELARSLPRTVFDVMHVSVSLLGVKVNHGRMTLRSGLFNAFESVSS